MAPRRDEDWREEFELGVTPHLDSLFNLALKMTRNRKDAEDLLQDTLLRAYRFFGSFEPGTNLRAWLFRILKNNFINRYRKGQREPSTVDFAKIEETFETLFEDSFRKTGRNPEEILVGSTLHEEVSTALEELPDEYRMVVVLALMQDRSYKEIAHVVGIPLGTVMSRLHRGRRLLQARLGEYAQRKGIFARSDRRSSGDADTEAPGGPIQEGTS